MFSSFKSYYSRMVTFYRRRSTPYNQKKLIQISPATIDRILKPYRTGRRKRMYNCTKPGKLLKSRIPIKLDQWNVKCPGFLEADTVALCEGSLFC